LTLNKTLSKETLNTNIVKLSKSDSGKPEIFVSIQGEGRLAGTPCVFVRLASCNLSCSWCDTKYTWDWKNYEYAGHVMTLNNDEIYSIIQGHNLKHVVITGGEPLLQQDALLPLITALSKNSYTIEIESNGTIEPLMPIFNLVNQWNISPKLSNSGNSQNKNVSLSIISKYKSHPNSYLKFVIVDEQDVYESISFAKSVDFPVKRLILMPEGSKASNLISKSSWLSDYCIKNGLRYSSRLHVLLWQGVRGK
tara:strand:- start:404 stop:1156 length:753 start_codon:yes stop_codon:yes gene_type:complete